MTITAEAECDKIEKKALSKTKYHRTGNFQQFSMANAIIII